MLVKAPITIATATAAVDLVVPFSSAGVVTELLASDCEASEMELEMLMSLSDVRTAAGPTVTSTSW